MPLTNRREKLPAVRGGLCLERNRKVFLIFTSALIPALAASAFLLTAVSGPTDDGLRCTRSGDSAVCQVRQTRFYGLFGNSAFTIQESAILGAKSVCSSGQVGGSRSPNCNVYLILNSGLHRSYPVLSYALADQANAAASKLNAYFADKATSSIDLKEDLLTPIALFGLVPVLVLAFVMGLRWWRLRTK